jgi:hypothetical protein
MATSPHLSQKIRETLGNEAGQELIGILGILDQVVSDISDLRGDVAELRHQMEIGFARVDGKLAEGFGRVDGKFSEGFGRVDGKFAEGFGRVDGKFAEMGKVIEQELRKQTQFFFLAWAVILAAIVGLYAR